ncbi:MAG TPA: hypothetical protein VHM92_09220 [Allosphingosinicella sp.]|nr:hypothetical protein [Allosphingosinicella sp.]
MLDPSDLTLWQPWLMPGERLIWTGTPPRGLRLGGYDFFYIPFSLMWGGFAIFWNVMVWTRGAPLLFTIWGLPFLLVGLYLIVGRFLHDAALRAATVYGLTDRRLLILRTWWRRGLRSHDLGNVPALEMKEHPDGRGTLTFDLTPSTPFNSRGTDLVPAASSIFRFYRIEQPRRVYELIRNEIERHRREIAAVAADAASYPAR